MKKIISIILGIMLMFAMSVTSFAYDYAPYTSVDDKVPTITITVAYDKEASTDLSKGLEQLSSSKTNPINGRKMVYNVTVKNNSSYVLSVENILNDKNFKIDFYNADGEAYPTYVVNAKNDLNLTPSGFDSEKIKGKAIEGVKGSSFTTTYVAYVVSAESFKTTTITCFDEEMKRDGVWTGTYVIISDSIVDNEDTSTSTNTSTPSEPEVTDKEETSTSTTTTTQPSTSTPEVTNPVTPETEEPSKAPADVDDTIPDTGATVPFAAIGTLVTSAITALVAKKKKEN